MFYSLAFSVVLVVLVVVLLLFHLLRLPAAVVRVPSHVTQGFVFEVMDAADTVQLSINLGDMLTRLQALESKVLSL